MKKAYLLLILLVAAFCMAALMGCPANRKPEKEVTRPDSFYYYPKANIYYHIPTHEFIYFDPENQEWNTSLELPDSLKDSLEQNVLLNDPPLPVWKENEQHRLIYSVSFYASPEDFKEKPVSAQPAPQAQVSQADTAVKKKESGVKRFFRRLFGGRKEKE